MIARIYNWREDKPGRHSNTTYPICATCGQIIWGRPVYRMVKSSKYFPAENKAFHKRCI